MSSHTPQFEKPQGGGTQNLNFVSTIRNQVLKGTLDSNVVDIQINLNGDGFTSDPSLVEFDQETFQIPNQNVYPEGLRLDYGTNTIEVRTIDVTGSISGEAKAEIEILRPNQVSLEVEAPSGLRVRRQRGSTELVWSKNPSPNVRGYHVYASTESGGGTEGYVRINRNLIIDPSFEEKETTEVAEDTTFYDNSFGQLRVLLTEEDFNDQPIQTVMDSAIDTSLAGERLKVTTSVENVQETTFFSFNHDRDGSESDGFINNEVFADLPDDEPLFYVITAVGFDPVTNQEIESAYSAELVGMPLTIDTQIEEMPRRDHFDVSLDFADQIREFDNEISVMPGSVPRDIFIDPFAEEAERLYFVADFIRRSQSFSTLLVVDSLNSYKESLTAALGLSDVSNVQPIIDDAFDKLAANVNVSRQGAEPAVGEVTFYTRNEPTSDMVVEQGTLVESEGGQTFRVTSRVVLPEDEKQSYYNRQRQQWEIQANIRATEPGSEGNVAAGQIESVIGGSSGLQVTNLEATQFGKDEETNEELAERAILAFASVDAGTEKGYLSTALSEPGVFRASVVNAGDPYMIRDYDDVRDEHVGGKVDVWVQGEKLVESSDTFAFDFELERDVQFFLDSNPSEYIFVADDDRLSPENPITKMLGETPSEQAQGFAFENLTTGEEFDLSDYTILDYNKIQLNTSISQPDVRPNDVISGDFRFRESTGYSFSQQPVRQVNSIRSLNTDDVLEEGVHYDLIKREDPLLQGQSTEANDYVQIEQQDGVPSGDVFMVNDESHVLVGEIPEPLNNLGVSPFSIRVFSSDRSVEYDGPSSSDPDFFVERGDETTPFRIIRNPSGDVGNGEEVSVDYEHDENFEVLYVSNELLSDVQSSLNDQRHVTADVLAKDAIANEIDLELTVVLRSGASRSQVDSKIRTSVSQLLNSKPLGESIHQSDVVQAIEDVKGVDYVIVPFAKMTHGDGNLIVREDVSNSFTFLEDSPNSQIYVLKDSLNYATSDTGGSDSTHKGVFQDRQPLEMVDSYNDLKSSNNSALIVGNGGVIISGFSDDPTLESQGFNTPSEREERRQELTANHVFVALDSDDSPENHTYEVSYEVQGDRSSASSIEFADVSFAELGDLTITYEEEGS